jgi:hypothetical protein
MYLLKKLFFVMGLNLVSQQSLIWPVGPSNPTARLTLVYKPPPPSQP